MKELINTTNIDNLNSQRREYIRYYVFAKKEVLQVLKYLDRVMPLRTKKKLTKQEKEKLESSYQKYKRRLIKLKSIGVGDDRFNIYKREWRQIKKRYERLIS